MFTTSRSTFDAAPGLGATAKHHSPFRLPPTACRSGFTLIELLIVISILAILASMVLFALAGAEGTAKEMRTQATITKLHNLIMQKYESYRTRRVPINVQLVTRLRRALPPGNILHIPASVPQMKAFALVRLDALRDLMRMEMPDGFGDIRDEPITVGMSRPSVSRGYKNVMDAIRLTPNFRAAVKHQESASCLYLIITRGLDDPDVLEQFSPSEIGDVDGDGLPEFLDAWGNPIKFLRWAPAHESSLQPKPPTDPDPFDPLHVYSGTFLLYPLIYSAGPDGQVILESGQSDAGYDIGEGPAGGFRYSTINNNPFHPSVIDHLGNAIDLDGSGSIDTTDNITNHDLNN